MSGTRKSHRAAGLMITATLVVIIAPAAMADPQAFLRRFDGLKSAEQQGVSVHTLENIEGAGVPGIIVGLRTKKTTSPIGNRVSARAFSTTTGLPLFDILAPAVQLLDSPNRVASLGDLTGDGRAEFAIGTPGASTVRIYSYGGAAPQLTLLGTLTGGPGSEFGIDVAAAGDFDGNSIPDIIVGAPGEGRAAVYSGRVSSGFPLITSLFGEPDNRFGVSVGTAGDIDGNGGSEVLVGAPLESGAADGSGNAGAVHVFTFSAAGGAGLVGSVRGSSPTDLLGADVDGGRDVNGDGTPDFIAGAVGSDVPPPWGAGQRGVGYVRSFSGQGLAPIRTFTSDQVGDFFGLAVALSDPCERNDVTLVVGAPQAVDSRTQMATGRVVAFNATTGAQLNEIFGEAALDNLGTSVGAFDDLDGSGAQFLAGAHSTSITNVQPLRMSAGSVFVFSCHEIPCPDISAAPRPVIFSAVGLGVVQTMAVNIENVGNADLRVTGLAFTPGTSADFSFSGATVPFVLTPLAQRQVTVEYSPSIAGASGGSLRVTSNDADTPTLDIGVAGSGIQPQIEVTPLAVAFGDVDVGESTARSVKVKNAGNGILTVANLVPPAGSVRLSAAPPLPKPLGPGQSFNFLAIFAPTTAGAANGIIQVESDDSRNPVVPVALNGSGVPPNLPPTAIIQMDVPYTQPGNNAGDCLTELGELAIIFRGSQSSDPEGQPLEFHWEFEDDGQSTTAMDRLRLFTCPLESNCPCLYVVRLTVTDTGGKSDTTSVTVIVWPKCLRSRFYGTILRGGEDVPDGTIVEAWVSGVKVAESLTQTHLGRSVFAIDVPPDSIQFPGGTHGDTVVFKYDNATANETGTWYHATDQELALTAPPPLRVWIPNTCIAIHPLEPELCADPPVFERPRTLYIEFFPSFIPVDGPDPAPFKVVSVFELNVFDEVGTQVHGLPPYQIRMGYTDQRLAALGVRNENSLGLYSIEGATWVRAGTDAIDVDRNEIVATLDHASVFALLGSGVENRFVRGDSNGDGDVDISDVFANLAMLFSSGSVDCLESCEVNGDGRIDISDPVYLLFFLFAGGGPPQTPFPACGEDPDAASSLGCARGACG